MPRLRPSPLPVALAALLLAIVAAGCGSGGSDGGEGPSAAALALSRRCDLGRPQSGSLPRELFPPGLLPADAVPFRWEGSGLGGRARIVLPVPLAKAQRAIDANAQRLGFPVLYRETEVFDAELDVQSGGEVLRFAFSPTRGCSDVTIAAVRKLAGPG